MKDCKNTQTFIKERVRESDCPMRKLKLKTKQNRSKNRRFSNNSCRALTFDFDSTELVQVVQKWSDKHPEMTYRNRD